MLSTGSPAAWDRRYVPRSGCPVIGIIGVLLLGTSGGPAVTETVSLYQLIGYNLLVLSAVIVLRVLYQVLRSSDRSPDQ